MGATLTTLNPALQRIWTSKKLEEQLYQETPFLSKIQKQERYSIGELARVPLHVSRNGAYSAIAAGGGAINTAGNQGLNKAEYTYTHHHVPVALAGDVIDQTSSSSLSVANAVNVEVDGALTDLKRNLQRQLFLNGDALIARCIASATNDVDLNYSGTEAIARGWIHDGQQVDVGTTANEVAISDGVTATVSGASTFTSSAGNVAGEGATHYVSQKDARSGATSYEMNGLRNIVSNSATIGGLAPGTYGWWKPANVDTTSQALTLDLMLQQDQAIHQKTGKKANFVLTGLKQQRRFYNLLQQQVRFGSDGSLGAGDQEGNPKWNGMQVFVDPDCPDGDMYFGQLEHLFIVAVDKPYWQNKITGGEILTWNLTGDSYVGKISYRIQLATDRRNAFARLGYTVDLAAAASGLS